ncbi:MAG: hypothetical protein ACFHWX_15695 [Bacteroidota bacterium]
MGWFSNNLIEDVEEFLLDMKVSVLDDTTEKEIENIIASKLRKEFERVHQQFNVEGYIGLKVDIDVNEEVGIELKLAKDLQRAHQIHRLFGQAVYYDKRKYDGNLLVLIVGSNSELKSPVINEVGEFLEELGISVVCLKISKGK